MGSRFIGRSFLQASPHSGGQSGRHYVDRRIDVGVLLMSAGYAQENRLALAVLRCAVMALRTGLRSVGWIHGLQASAGALAFVGKHPPKVGVSVGQHRSVQTGLLPDVATRLRHGARRRRRHLFDLQVLDHDQGVRRRQVGGKFVGGVLPAVGEIALHLGVTLDRAATPRTAFEAAANDALEPAEPLVLPFAGHRQRNVFARRHRDRPLHAQIEPNAGASGIGHSVVPLDAKADGPVTALASDGDVADLPVHRTGPPETNPAEFRQKHEVPFELHLFGVWESDRAPVPFAAIHGEPGPSGEEGGKRLVQIAERRLERVMRGQFEPRVLLLQSDQERTEVIVADRADEAGGAGRLRGQPNILAIPQSPVPQPPVRAAGLHEHPLLPVMG